MADWRKVAKAAILADGSIGEREFHFLVRQFADDGVISKDELEFLLELRNEAKSAVPQFHQFVFRVVKALILKDGNISDEEALWLRKLILADHVIQRNEVAFLQELKDEARSVGPEFLKLFNECCYSGDFSR